MLLQESPELLLALRPIQAVLYRELHHQDGLMVQDLHIAEEEVGVNLVHVLSRHNDRQRLLWLPWIDHLCHAGGHVHILTKPAFPLKLASLVAALKGFKVHVLPLLAIRQGHHNRHSMLADLCHVGCHLGHLLSRHYEISLLCAAGEDPSHWLQPEMLCQLSRPALLFRLPLHHHAVYTPLLRRFIDCVHPHAALLVHRAV
mmetsp:Transcript_9567/g.27379  ORF Transcript_9567/g.27379 Transcript_9567/m.27379 type:complete len:201 (+) Transcript_9567:596-1198(+)